MTEELKKNALLEEPVVRMLELQSKYGIDQETMLIYICSVNLTSILSLIGKRQQGNSGGHIQKPLTAPVAPGTVSAPAPENAGNNQSLNNLASMLSGMLSSQGGANTNSQGVNPAALLNMLGGIGGKDGQGLNPALLTSLLGALGGGQGIDLGNMMNMMSSFMGSVPKPTVTPTKPASSAAVPTKAALSSNPPAEERQPIREMPKILKWNQLDNRKRA
ncbi:MAG: hypothetical protein PHD36_04475 [Desulfotomaculaceae bacterium]|nr:hypothetical protein [Desulfotomaculaceae bacterium]